MFCCAGGSGSSYLYRRLKRYFKHVSLRPETYFLPDYFPQQKKSATKHDQKLSSLGYQEYPTTAAMKGFEIRSGFKLDPTVTIDKNLFAYVTHIRHSPKNNVLFSRAPMLGFFARNKISDVVFVVRHPLHQYISLTKAHRHFEFVKDYGGVNTLGGVNFFIQEWKRYVNDALGSNAKIIRYEYAKQDAQRIRKDIGKVFGKWKVGQRNFGQIGDQNSRKCCIQISNMNIIRFILSGYYKKYV